MKILDYLLMRTPKAEATPARLGESENAGLPPLFQRPPTDAGKMPGDRIVLSILGLFLGILASFYITGLAEIRMQQPKGGEVAVHHAQGTGESSLSAEASDIEPRLAGPFAWKRLLSHSVITLVVCMLTYQSLYFSLALYKQAPTFLILFVSFQYGFFWQSVIKGGAALL